MSDEKAAVRPEWLSLVPPPRPRPEPATPFGPPPIQWDVFLSYRSKNRTWALALYDQLVAAGFRVFLDQFVLHPGLELETSLHDALKQSGSGVLVFSKDVEEAGWVDKERQKMQELEKQRASSPLPFNYVIARIDESPLPFSDQGVIFADFSKGYEDGPRGDQLVRLIQGLVGAPLSNRSARSLAKMEEETIELLREVASAKDRGDFDEIVAIMSSERPQLAQSPNIAIEAAQSLISKGGDARLPQALQIIHAAQRYFPRSVRLAQMEGLAFRRSPGGASNALKVLSKLYVDGHRDPETLGIYAAAFYQRYKADGDRTDLERSRDLYAEAFEISPKNEYVGINAASKSAFLGELDAAKALATKVGALVRNAANGQDFYKSMSLAEALVITGYYDQAVAVYQAARTKNAGRNADVAGTLSQLSDLIPILKVPDESAAKLRRALGATS